MAKGKKEEVERHQKEIERINNKRKNLDSYAALLSQVEGALRSLRVAAARAPAQAPPAPGPSRSTTTRPATVQSIISGKQYAIRSVVHDRYAPCEEDEMSG